VFICDRNYASTFIKNYSSSYLTNIAKTEATVEEWNDAFKNGFDKQAETLSPLVDTIWNALESNYELQEPWDYYLHNVRRIKSSLQILHDQSLVKFSNKVPNNIFDTFARILPSYIHMMNNRLGIPITDESYLAFLIHSSLQQQVK
jgi:hypothetical protein